MIYLKFPDDTVCLDMPPLMTDDNEDAEYSIKVEKTRKSIFLSATRERCYRGLDLRILSDP